MRTIVRTLSLALVAVMLLGMCSGAFATAEEPKKVELVFVCPGAVPFDELPDNALVLEEIQKRYLADRNVDLNIIIRDCSWTGYEDMMQVQMASSDVKVDMFPAWSSMAEKFITNEMVLPIDEALAEYGPHIMEVVPELAWRWMTVDGKKYGLPRLRALEDVQFKVIRKDWLDMVGLPVPQTFEELETALYAICELDPVGNGQTIGQNTRVTGGGISVERSKITANQMTDYYLGEDGMIYHGSQHPDVKESLDRGAKYLADGIINKDAFTVSRDEQEARVSQHKVVTTDLKVSGIISHIMSLRDVYPEGEYAVLPGTVKGKGYEQSKAVSDFLLVPANSKNLENLISFFDWMLEDKENFLLVRYGIEDRHYVKVGDQIDRIENADGTYDYDGVLNGTFDMYGLAGYGSDAVVDFVIQNFSDPEMQDIYENEYQDLLAQMKAIRADAYTPDLFGFTYKLDGIAAQTRDTRLKQYNMACGEYVTGQCDWAKVQAAIDNYANGLGGKEEFEQVNEQYQAWCAMFNCR